MKSDSYASLVLVLLEPSDGNEEEQDLFNILDRMRLAPEDYRDSDSFWEEYESELAGFSAGLLQPSAEESLPFDDPDSDFLPDDDCNDDTGGGL